MLESTFRYCFFLDPDYQGGSPPRLSLTQINPDQPLTLFGFDVVPLVVEHGRMEVFAYRFGDFAYVTDCSHIPPRSFELLKGLRYLVLDGLRYRPHKTHFTLEQAAVVAEQLEAEHTYLTHLSHEVEHEAGNALLRRVTSAKVELAYDGLVLEF